MSTSSRIPSLYLAILSAVVLTAAATNAADVPVYKTTNALAGSLRQAIQDASPNDTIVFQIPTSDPGYTAANNTYRIVLTGDSLIINKNLTINGASSSGRIEVERSSAGGTPGFQIFRILAGNVVLTDLTMSNGSGVNTFGAGGGIYCSNAALTVRNCTFVQNDGNSEGGGIYAQDGSLNVINSTFVGNRAYGGGAIGSFQASLFVSSCTITGNDGRGYPGGGISVYQSPAVRIRNTIVALNVSAGSAPDLAGAFASEGYNLIGSSSGSTGFGATGDQVGATAAQVGLSNLADNGGHTRTLRPQPGSLAIDQGSRGLDEQNQPINTDQRGLPRPTDLTTPNAVMGDGSDIGAVEVGPAQTGPTFTVTNTDAGADGSCTTDDCTLFEALQAANADADANTIIFGANVTGAIVGFPYLITAPVTINGPGARVLKLSTFNGRIFRVSPNIAATITGLTIAEGQAASEDGGGIHNSGQLTLRDCIVRDNAAIYSASVGGGSGGGIMNVGGATLTLERCTFVGNIADGFGGGGLFNAGQVTATNCTFQGNGAINGGAILSVSNNGTSLATFRNCTIANNYATSTSSSGAGGGGYYGEGAPGNTLHHFSNTIIAGNSNSVNPDLRGYGTSEGNNLVGNLGQAGSGFSHVNGDKVGVAPGFGSFGDNGGSTDTLSLLANSPAINMGNNNLAPLADQRGYLRVGVSDIGAFEFNGTVPPAVSLVSVVSRKVHSGVAFDVALPGVESRSGGVNGDHTLVFTFSSELVSAGPPQVTSGVGYVSNAQIGADKHQYVISLTGVANAQDLSISLTNLIDAAGSNSSAVPVSFGLLFGDSNADRAVNSGDAQQTRNRSGQATGATNFRSDFNLDGTINSGDATVVRSRSGQFIP